MNLARREFLAGAGAFAASGLMPVFSESDGPELAAAKKWFAGAGFGMMSHFGLYTLLGNEWNGRTGRHPYGEWIMHSEKIPLAEYRRLAAAFNPIRFDALEWMKRARDAGMKYFVLTSKHHDGFALFRSKVSKYNVVDATPFKRDIVGELAEACRATGVKLGLYYSQDLDWSEEFGGGRNRAWHEHGTGRDVGRMWGNDWDWPALKKGEPYDFQRYLDEKSMPQVKEILTQYGDLCLIWFDVPVTLSFEQSKAFVDLVRKHQPGCLINGRIGHDLGDYFTPGDNEVPEKAKGEKLYEVIGTMNESWGYSPTDVNYRSIERLKEIKAHCAAISANYMLNVGPDPLGRFPAKACELLDGFGKQG